jgi:hypothetical protein
MIFLNFPGLLTGRLNANLRLFCMHIAREPRKKSALVEEARRAFTKAIADLFHSSDTAKMKTRKQLRGS